MTSVAELRASFPDDARGRAQTSRNAALLGARQAFEKPKQTSAGTRSGTNIVSGTPKIPSARYSSSSTTTPGQQPPSQRARAVTAGNRIPPTATKGSPIVQRPSLPSAGSKAAAAAVAHVWQHTAPAIAQPVRPLQHRFSQWNDVSTSRPEVAIRPLSQTFPKDQEAYSVRTVGKTSAPNTIPQSRPETRFSQANTLAVTERSKSELPSPSGIAAALAAARFVPSIQPTIHYVELIPTSGPTSHVKKWLQSLESLSPEQGSPLRSSRGPWRPTIVNMPEVPPKPDHLSVDQTLDEQEPEQAYFDAVEMPIAHNLTSPITLSDYQLPSFQINSPKTTYTKSIVDTIEEASFDGMATIDEFEVVKRKAVPASTERTGQPSLANRSPSNYDRASISPSLAGEQLRDSKAASIRFSQPQSDGRRSTSLSRVNRFHSVGKPDYFYSSSHLGSISHPTSATSPEPEHRSESLTRPPQSRMNSRSTIERAQNNRLHSRSSTTDMSTTLMSPPPLPRPSLYSRQSYASTNLSLPQPAQMLLSDNTGSSLPSRSALLASNLATSRAPSPTKVPPLPSGRRQSEKSTLDYLRSSSHTRTPSPAKKLRHTLRKERTEKDDDEPRARRRNKLIRKHPHKHNEGDRKRWRDTITERERKRYEGLWAANRGIYIHGEPIDGRTEGSTYNPAQAQKVCSLVVRDIWTRSRLPANVLEEIWDLVDTIHDGTLRKEDFVVGMWLIDQQLKGRKLPVKVGQSVWDSVWLVPGVKRRKNLK